ncbi:zonular occludens toxin domain-containing protein [Variovorax sp. tm]|uniref:zonular occludens toxin domain-containing protein n=1 Tax=Variovorax atrisoli TaxID=3394203 RepID=UPI003A7FAF1D
MLTVVTGLPGSGKTAGVVERFLMPLAAKDWQENASTPDGEKVVIKRRLFTNINGLLLEHELIDADDLLRWHEWVKPGDLIVFDEVQKPWPLTGANKEQPKCITELETHRHYGIDMILMTQHPMLINAAIVRLAGQHLHIRKLGNSRFATIYEWDGVSRTLLYKNAFAKKAWRRSKAAEKVYRSSSLHTKQKRAIPTVLWVVLACLLIFPFGAWKWSGDFRERYFGGKPLIPGVGPGEKAAVTPPGASPPSSGGTALAAGPRVAIDDATAWIPRDPARPESAPAYDEVRKVAVMPVVAGCIRMGNRTRCVTQQGTDAGLSEHDATAWLVAGRFNPYAVQTAAAGGMPHASGQNAPEARAGAALTVIDGPGWRDPLGMQGQQGSRR